MSVCHSVGGSHVTPTHDPLDLTVQAPTRCHYTGGSPNPGLATWTLDLTGQGPPAPLGHRNTLDRDLLMISGGHHWRPVETFSLDLTVPGPPQYWHLVATKAGTVGKWVVCILLECFLVTYCCWSVADLGYLIKTTTLTDQRELYRCAPPLGPIFFSISAVLEENGQNLWGWRPASVWEILDPPLRKSNVTCLKLHDSLDPPTQCHAFFSFLFRK